MLESKLVQKNLILISACLIGDYVRYDGKNKLINHPILKAWLEQDLIVSICPEVAGGLEVPRPPAEIRRVTINTENSQSIKTKVLTKQSQDVTAAFTNGAQKALAVCLKHNIKLAILTEGSPSCGSSLINDGYFRSKKIPGEGITTALLRKNNIKVYNQKQLEEAFEFHKSLI